MDEQIIRGLQTSTLNMGECDSGSVDSRLPTVGTPMSSQQAMTLAIQQAVRGLYKVSPNPAVGCVVLDALGCYLASGYHEYYGGPHAEVNALKNLSMEQLRGAQVFVTLEPCAHEGKTPSCAKMLIKYPIAKVVYGLKDPNPLVAGQGAAILQESGIAAELFPFTDPLQLELQEVCEAFLWNQNHKKPFVALKIASSLDSQLALQSGESRWITGERARHYVHHLRACYDGLLVTAKTILADNPELNIRGIKTEKTNSIIILDRRGKLLECAHKLKLFKTHKLEKIILFADENLKDEILKKKNELISQNSFLNELRIEFIPVAAEHLHLRTLLERCWDLKIYSIFIEAGARLAGALIAAKIIQRLYLFESLSLFGADQQQSWTQGLQIQDLQDRLFLQNPRFLGFSGQDFLISALLKSE